MSQPKLKSEDLFAQISGLNGDFDFNSFEARRIWKDIRDLRDVAPADSFMFEGMMNALAWQSDEAIAAFEKAKFLGCTTVLLENYALSMSLLSLHDRALDIYKKLIAYGEVTDQVDVAFGLWCAAAAADIDAYQDIEAVYKKASSKESNVPAGRNDEVDSAEKSESDTDEPAPFAVKVFKMDRVKSFMESVNSFVDSYDIDKSSLKEVMSLVGSVANNNKIRFSVLDSKIDDFYGDSVLHLRFMVDEATSEIHQLNEQLLDKLVDKEDLDTISKNVVASFGYEKT